MVAPRLVLSGLKGGSREKELIARPQLDVSASFVESTMHLQPFCGSLHIKQVVSAAVTITFPVNLPHFKHLLLHSNILLL